MSKRYCCECGHYVSGGVEWNCLANDKVKTRSVCAIKEACEVHRQGGRGRDSLRTNQNEKKEKEEDMKRKYEVRWYELGLTNEKCRKFFTEWGAIAYAAYIEAYEYAEKPRIRKI